MSSKHWQNWNKLRFSRLLKSHKESSSMQQACASSVPLLSEGLSYIFQNFCIKYDCTQKTLFLLLLIFWDFTNIKGRLFRISQRLKAFAPTEQPEQIVMSRDYFKSFLRSLYQFWGHRILMAKMSNVYSKICKTYRPLIILNFVKISRKSSVMDIMFYKFFIFRPIIIFFWGFS